MVHVRGMRSGATEADIRLVHLVKRSVTEVFEIPRLIFELDTAHQT